MEPQEQKVSPSQNNNFLPVSILIAAVLISGSIFYAVHRAPASGEPNGAANVGNDQPPALDPKTAQVIGERDVILGDPKAPVTIVEYSDFQCPFCGKFFTETESKIKDEYVKTGKVRFVYRAIAFLGPESLEAAKAAECAKDQSKFWVFHDALFAAEVKDGQEYNGNLNRDLFMKIAQEVKLNTTDFASCYDSGKYTDVVKAETEKAYTVGVAGTPTFFVNENGVRGAQPFESFKSIIDKLVTAR